MRILVVTPRCPFSRSGACEKDRTQGILDLIRLGHSVYVITKTLPKDEPLVTEFARANNITVRGVPYTTRITPTSKLQYVQRLVSTLFDGAAAEYADPAMVREVKTAFDTFSPDVVWFEYTYLWPLYSMVRKRRIPIITRSINYEPAHFLDEVGRTLGTYLRYPSKVLSEWLVTRMSNVMCAITPQEEARYKALGAKKTYTLPLRDLPNVLARRNTIRDSRPLQCCFMGSTYSVPHNRRALFFLLTTVMPALRQDAPGMFTLNITGKKFPDEYLAYVGDDVTYTGYVDDLDAFLDRMDIAIVPSIAGHGMQQKIFEPITRGLPTVTHCRGLAGYPFHNSAEVMCVSDDAAFAGSLMALEKYEARAGMSEKARATAETIFSRAAIDQVIEGALTDALHA